ncbi:MAG: protealysin inhibitor emfourin [Nocardioidaceae bacterium]
MTDLDSTRRVVAASAAACLLLITACGSQDTASSANQPGRDPSSSATVSSTQSVRATTVTVRRTGGIAGVDDSWTVRADKPGDLSPRAAAEVLRIASSPAFRAIDPTKPTQRCCDFFSYAVSVSYSDGSQLQFHTDDGSRQPAPLEQLLGFFG